MHSDVPVIILERLPSGVTVANIRDHCINEVNAAYSFGGVLTLEELGMDRWPFTPTGKIHRLELQRAALKCLEARVFTPYPVTSTSVKFPSLVGECENAWA
jgi:hypothetical protein